MLLTGEHLVIAGARKPFSWHCGTFRYSAPGQLRAFLRHQAEMNLARRCITEPVTWEPPDDWAAWPAWPGTSPASLSGGDADAVLAGAGSVHEAAAAAQPATGSGGRSTAVSIASRSRPARWPTGS
jgi:hypothetical protein